MAASAERLIMIVETVRRLSAVDNRIASALLAAPSSSSRSSRRLAWTRVRWSGRAVSVGVEARRNRIFLSGA